MKEKIKDIYYYIKLVKTLQEMRKDNPNNFIFGSKMRGYLESLEENTPYEEKRVSL
jgi:hypothetical protein